LNLEPLKYYLRVAELGSLTKAASTLGISQPIISRSVAQLERELGGRLFDRTGHGVQLTPLGVSLLDRTRVIVHEVETLMVEASSYSNIPAGEVRVGMLPSFSTTVVSALLEQAGAQLPNVKVKIFVGSTTRLDDWLDEGRIDISLNFANNKPLGDAQFIGNFEIYLVGIRGSFLDQLETIDFKDLGNLPLILPATRSGLRKKIDDVAGELAVKLTPVMEVDTSTLYLKLVKEGHGYAITTLHALPKDRAAVNLVAVRIVRPQITRDILLGTSLRSVPSLATRRLLPLLTLVSKNLLQVQG
jgi:LysR family nitrogen assimilation transcriptional regulator